MAFIIPFRRRKKLRFSFFLCDDPFIYRNYTTMTVPIIDGVDHETFEYKPVYQADILYVFVRHCHMTVHSATATSQNDACTYQCITWQMCIS